MELTLDCMMVIQICLAMMLEKSKEHLTDFDWVKHLVLMKEPQEHEQLKYLPVQDSIESNQIESLVHSPLLRLINHYKNLFSEDHNTQEHRASL